MREFGASSSFRMVLASVVSILILECGICAIVVNVEAKSLAETERRIQYQNRISTYRLHSLKCKCMCFIELNLPLMYIGIRPSRR
ncbi:hypothetical protein BDZ97DRAFT_1800054 [Flammula alnicola]|nr:hypothetical protein BDZ97DRAFT_1800054 [Flammula alnicola]